MSLPVVRPASRSVFAGRSSFRVVDADATERFIGANEITRQMVIECPVLAEIVALDATKYLAEYCGMPGLVKGCSTWGNGMLVFSENLKHMTRVCESRVAGNKIKFNHGSEEFKEARPDVWEFCVKMCRVDVITKMRRENVVNYIFVLSRPDETACPVCLEALQGNVVQCSNTHQVCLPCFNLLSGVRGHKKCPTCRSHYKDEELSKIDRMNGLEVKDDPYFVFNLSGGNSFKAYTYNEALFMGMLKNQCQNNLMDNFRQMLMSSLYNYYSNHKDAFSLYDFNFTYHSDSGRMYNPFNDELGQVVCDYINEIDTPEIYNDVAYTDFFLNGYDDIQFYRELEDIEGNVNRIKEYPNDKKNILRREVYFRYKVKQANANGLMEYFKNIFQRIANSSKGHYRIFKNQIVELD